MIQRGDIVRHARFGLGTVLRIMHSGYSAVVSFGKFRLELPVHELEKVNEGIKTALGTVGEGDFFDRNLKYSKKKDKKLVPITPKRAKSRYNYLLQILESLRLGLVPNERIEEWTFGRDKEIEFIKQWLKDDAEGSLLIEGEYGMGKSHLIRYLAHNALNDGYAVAITGYDPSERTGVFPKRLYRNLVQNFRIPVQDRILDFRGFLNELAGMGAHKFFKGHPFLEDFFRELEQDPENMDDRLWAWIHGRNVRIEEKKTFYDHRTAANIYCNLLSSFSVAAVRLLGASGMLLLFDEAEMIRTSTYGYELEGALNLIRALSMVANDEHDLLDEKVRKSQDGPYKGVDTGLFYSGFHKEVRYAFQIPTFLKVAFALTPIESRTFKAIRKTMPVVTLEPLKKRDIIKMFRKTMDAYMKVYGLTLDKKWKDGLIREIELHYGGFEFTSIRKLVKTAVEALDIARFYPQLSVREIFDGATGT